jgi:hypothetical protein
MLLTVGHNFSSLKLLSDYRLGLPIAENIISIIISINNTPGHQMLQGPCIISQENGINHKFYVLVLHQGYEYNELKLVALIEEQLRQYHLQYQTQSEASQ